MPGRFSFISEKCRWRAGGVALGLPARLTVSVFSLFSQGHEAALADRVRGYGQS